MKLKSIIEPDTYLRSDLALSGDIADASAFNFSFADPGSGSGLPDLATSGEVINGNQVNNMFTGGDGADTFIFARYGAGDTSIDTITDFQTGLDHIDLTTFHIDASRAQIDNVNDTLLVDTDANGSYDMTIIVHGNDVAVTDLVF